MKKILWLFGMLALFGNFANAETDLLNLDSYAEGTRVPYGENMVVVQDKETSEKWITAAKGTSGRMNIPISLPKTGNFTFDLDMSSVKPTLTNIIAYFFIVLSYYRIA